MTLNSISRRLVVVATIISGLSSGLLGRDLITVPAWRQSGLQAWADYNRHAEFGAGVAHGIYLASGYLLWALVLAAAIAYRMNRSAPRSTGRPIYLAVLSTIGAMATTIVAARIMQNVGRLATGDSAALHHCFTRFTLWGVYLRDDLIALTFVFMLWALIDIYRHESPPKSADELSLSVDIDESPSSR